MTRIHSISILALLWTGWCFLHSLLISRGFTARMQGILGRRYGYYRLAYTIISLFSLLPVVYFQLRLPEKVIFAWPWPWYLMKYGMYAGAFLLFYGGFRVYDLQYMLGIKQIHAMPHIPQDACCGKPNGRIIPPVPHGMNLLYAKHILQIVDAETSVKQ